MKKIYTKPTVEMMQLQPEERLATCDPVYNGAKEPPRCTDLHMYKNATGYSA